MANEIRVNARLSVENGSYKNNFQPTSLQFDQTTQGAQGGIMTVSSTADIVLGSTQLATEGWLAMRNLDAANWVNYGSVSSTTVALTAPLGRMKAGEPAILRTFPNVIIKMRASTTGAADVNVQYIWHED